MKKLLLFILLSSLFMNISLCNVGEILQIIGDVEVERGGTRIWNRYPQGTEIMMGDRIKTLSGFSAIILDNSTKIRLNDYSLVEISEVEKEIDSTKYKFKLFRGEIYISTIRPRNKITVITPDFLIKGYNGEINIKSTESKTVFKSIKGSWQLNNTVSDVNVNELFYTTGERGKPLENPKKLVEDFIPIWHLSKFADNIVKFSFEKADTNIVKCRVRVYNAETGEFNKDYKGTLNILSYNEDFKFSEDNDLYQEEIKPYAGDGTASFFIKGSSKTELSRFFIGGYEIKPVIPEIYFRRILDKEYHEISIKVLVQEQEKDFRIRFDKKPID